MAKPKKLSKQRFNVPMDARKRFADLLAPVKFPGRPSGYHQKFCDEVIRLGAEGKSRMAIAASLGICRLQLSRWEDKYPEFKQALARGKALEQKWWENIGEQGLVMGNQINSSIWAKSMSSRFKEDYTERSEISGPNGGEIPHKLEIEFVGMKPVKKEK